MERKITHEDISKSVALYKSTEAEIAKMADKRKQAPQLLAGPATVLCAL